MNTLGVIAPLLTAVAIAVGATALHRRVRPRLSAALLTGGIVAVAAAVLPTLLILSIGFLVHLPMLGGGLEWCKDVLGFHASVNPWLGTAASGLLALGTFRSARSLRAWRRHRCPNAGTPAMVDSDEWFAYSLPGPGQRIALSSGLVAALDTDELQVVLAHERGHANHRHDRHLLTAELAACYVPPLEWLRRRLRFALERWADEEAVEASGGDRERVALTLAKVALGASQPVATMAAFNGLGVAARVDALLHPQRLRFEGLWTSAIGLGLVAVALAAAVQAHHVSAMLIALCPG